MSKSSNENYQKWLAVYGRLVDFSLEDWLLMAPYVKIGHITADTMLFEQGEKISSVYFLLDGYGRYFYLDEKGNERNKSLLQKGGAFSCLSCYLEEQPSPFSTQALTDSVIAEIRYADLITVSEQNLNWGRFVRKIYEQLVLKKEKREAALLQLSAKERYLRFITENQPLSRSVALRHIAMYLGITDVSLSRIRKELGLT
ncbi:Crp/Fnr family transcriptional regulator [Pseudoalteromonas piscicida]|uniref:Crp/Fnr family transcriptional regulator n=1 Tax=Pseudoalteromonas piscicida TaxID=43662 RepID=UPI001C984DC5|nr:Crp/Fnr family transcriptional regulator [Pseudoalteromonas piscicida]QZO15154.1 Crp/Fnr family transcriptional regulator [Pseudoalteromonas piscicida]